MQSFGELIKEARRRAGMTQRELADMIDVDDSYISKIEKGVSPIPPREKVLAIADVLGITGKKERAFFLATADSAGLEELQGLGLKFTMQQPQQAVGGVFGAPIGLTSEYIDEDEHPLQQAVYEIVAEYNLPFGERGLAQRMILETTRTICRVLKEELEGRGADE